MTAFFGMGILFTLYLLFAVRELGLNTVQLGFIIAMGGVGAFAGAWVTNRTAHLPPSRVFFLASLVVGTVQFLIPLASVFPKWGVLLLGAAQLFGDAAWSLLYVSETTYRQQVTIASALGRVNAAMQLAGRGVLPIGALTGGFLAERASVAATLWTGAALVFLATFWIPRREPARNPAA
jgi:predicted MFS family arabinose efflux permease